MITTLFGEDVTVTIDMGTVMINNATVIVADIEADNGVVHVIDAVLLPPAPVTVVDIIVNSPDHETLEAAVIAAELDDDLSGEGPFTVFAPTDAAFDALPEGVLDVLLADPTGDLANILLYHVVGAEAFAADLSDGQILPTLLADQDLTVSIMGGDVMINNALVIVADLEADNGVVHVIDAVLTPTVGVEDAQFEGFGLYPNPTSDVLTIAGEFPANTVVKVFDQTGRQVLETTMNGNRVIDVSSLSEGYYTLTATFNNAVAAKRFAVY
jgi:transforming growth factor-beta-induced protein